MKRVNKILKLVVLIFCFGLVNTISLYSNEQTMFILKETNIKTEKKSLENKIAKIQKQLQTDIFILHPENNSSFAASKKHIEDELNKLQQLLGNANPTVELLIKLKEKYTNIEKEFLLLLKKISVENIKTDAPGNISGYPGGEADTTAKNREKKLAEIGKQTLANLQSAIPGFLMSRSDGTSAGSDDNNAETVTSVAVIGGIGEFFRKGLPKPPRNFEAIVEQMNISLTGHADEATTAYREFIRVSKLISKTTDSTVATEVYELSITHYENVVKSFEKATELHNKFKEFTFDYAFGGIKTNGLNKTKIDSCIEKVISTMDDLEKLQQQAMIKYTGNRSVYGLQSEYIKHIEKLIKKETIAVKKAASANLKKIIESSKISMTGKEYVDDLRNLYNNAVDDIKDASKYLNKENISLCKQKLETAEKNLKYVLDKCSEDKVLSETAKTTQKQLTSAFGEINEIEENIRLSRSVIKPNTSGSGSGTGPRGPKPGSGKGSTITNRPMDPGDILTPKQKGQVRAGLNNTGNAIYKTDSITGKMKTPTTDDLLNPQFEPQAGTTSAGVRTGRSAPGSTPRSAKPIELPIEYKGGAVEIPVTVKKPTIKAKITKWLNTGNPTKIKVVNFLKKIFRPGDGSGALNLSMAAEVVNMIPVGELEIIKPMIKGDIEETAEVMLSYKYIKPEFYNGFMAEMEIKNKMYHKELDYAVALVEHKMKPDELLRLLIPTGNARYVINRVNTSLKRHPKKYGDFIESVKSMKAEYENSKRWLASDKRFKLENRCSMGLCRDLGSAELSHTNIVINYERHITGEVLEHFLNGTSAESNNS